MSTMLSDKKVRLRKPCRCFGCGRAYKKDDTIRKTVMVDGSDFSSSAWCEVCTAYWNKYMGYDDTIGFGELKECDPEKWEALRAIVEPTLNNPTEKQG